MARWATHSYLPGRKWTCCPHGRVHDRRTTTTMAQNDDFDAPELRERFDHEDAGQRRPSGKVSGEEGLVASEVPPSAGRHTGDDVIDLVDEQERRPVRQDLVRAHGGMLP